MKNYLIAMIIAFTSFGASAQQVALDNYTSCDYYVTLVYVNSSCSASQDITVVVPAGSMSLAGPTPPVGWTFNRALVHYTLPASPGAYYVKIQSPWANCPYSWLNQCEVDTGCMGLATESCVDGTPAVPRVVIVN